MTSQLDEMHSSHSKSPPGESTERLLLDVRGIHCASCVGRVEAAVSKLPGARHARANLATHHAAIAIDPWQTGQRELIEALPQAGYEATPAVPVESAAALAMSRVLVVAISLLLRWESLDPSVVVA